MPPRCMKTPVLIKLKVTDVTEITVLVCEQKP